MIAALAHLLLAATLEVSAGDDLAAALARAREGDVVRLGPGLHAAALGALRGVTVEGAGAGLTIVAAPEGEDGARVTGGDVALSALSLRAGPERCGLVVRGGRARLARVELTGGACGARLEAGSLAADGVDLGGRTGLVVSGGEASLRGGSARGERAAAVVLGGVLALERFSLFAGPDAEAGLVAAGGACRLSVVTIRAPGALGLSASTGARVSGAELTVVGGGATEDEVPGVCLLARRAEVRVVGGLLARCGGAALHALGGRVDLAGVDAAGGLSGCFLLEGGAVADLSGDTCAGRGPGLLLAGGAKGSARLNSWWTDPVRWVDCGSGARLTLGPGEPGPTPCAGTAKPASTLDKRSPK